MKVAATRCIAVAVLIAVVVVFVAPGVDLDPTALRSMRAAQALQAALAASAVAFSAFVSRDFLHCPRLETHSLAMLHDHLFDLNCSRLC